MQQMVQEYSRDKLMCSGKEGDEFLESIVTGDGMWVHHLAPQKKTSWNTVEVPSFSGSQKNSKCVSLLENLWNVHSGMQKGSSTLNACLRAQ
jgi:hypothetical protein